MKKLFLSFIFCCTLFSQDNAELSSDEIIQNNDELNNVEFSTYDNDENFIVQPQPQSPKGLLEAKVSYFRPTKKTFRQIYSSGAMYGIEGSIQANRQLYAWASVSYFPKSGSTIEGNNSTRIHLVPIGFGLKYLFIFNSRNDSFYLGAGILPTYLKTRVHSPFLISKTTKWGIGGIAKAGCIVNLPYSLFLDFFADYMYLKIKFSNRGTNIFRNKADLSGGSAGIGIGYRF